MLETYVQNKQTSFTYAIQRGKKKSVHDND